MLKNEINTLYYKFQFKKEHNKISFLKYIEQKTGWKLYYFKIKNTINTISPKCFICHCLCIHNWFRIHICKLKNELTNYTKIMKIFFKTTILQLLWWEKKILEIYRSQLLLPTWIHLWSNTIKRYYIKLHCPGFHYIFYL